MSLYGLGLRASFKISDTIRDRGLQAPKDIVRFDNLLYGTDPRWQTLDVYRPRNAGGTALPVIVSVHGGGWVYGDKNLYQHYCMSLAQHGFAVVNFSYRLAPRHKFPAALQDTDAVFHWVMAHAVDYHFDTRHVFAVGDSAGANILGLYAARCADPAAANIPVTPPPGFVPTALALNCGQYCISRGQKGLIAHLLPDILPDGGTDAELHAMDVTAHVTGRYPPCFVMTANNDFLKEQAPLMTAPPRRGWGRRRGLLRVCPVCTAVTVTKHKSWGMFSTAISAQRRHKTATRKNAVFSSVLWNERNFLMNQTKNGLWNSPLLRAQVTWVGFTQTIVEFDRPERVAGETHYTLKKMVRLAESGVFPNSDYPLTLPLKLGILGGFLSVACFIVFIVLACCKIYFGGLVAWLFPFVALSGSIALVCHGLSNIYISMVYREVQSRPKYIVAEKINL